MLLVGEHGVGGHAHLLSPLDLAVPVRTLDQTTHQAHVVLPCEHTDVFDEFKAACLIRLQGQTKTAPSRALRLHLFEQRFEHVERQFEAIHLFSVNGEIDLRSGGHFAKLPHARHQLVDDSRMLRIFVTRMQRGEFDRDSVRLFGAL